MVDESSVGITQFANSAAPISGILRHRYSDFKVNEIDTQMRVARLTDEDLRPENQAAPVVERVVKSFDDEGAIEACVKQFSDLAGPEHATALSALLDLLRQRVRPKPLSLACESLGSWHCSLSKADRHSRPHDVLFLDAGDI